MAIHTSRDITRREYEIAAAVARSITGRRLPPHEELVLRAVVGTVEIVGCVTESDSPWFFGPYGFVLRNPRRLARPVPCAGRLGFWTVPAEVEAQMEYGEPVGVAREVTLFG